LGFQEGRLKGNLFLREADLATGNAGSPEEAGIPEARMHWVEVGHGG
jgi:hypothetical protein